MQIEEIELALHCFGELWLVVDEPGVNEWFAYLRMDSSTELVLSSSWLIGDMTEELLLGERYGCSVREYFETHMIDPAQCNFVPKEEEPCGFRREMVQASKEVDGQLAKKTHGAEGGS